MKHQEKAQMAPPSDGFKGSSADLSQELADIQHEFEQFAYIVSHDLRAPLRHASQFSQFLLDESRAAGHTQYQPHIDRILEATSNIEEMLDSLLTFSRVGRKGLTIEEIDLNQLVDETLFSLKTKVETYQAKICYHELPLIRADRATLMLLLEHLLDNAMKFHQEERRPVIEVFVEKDDKGIKLCVKDNGIGIDSQFYEKIFHIFRCLHAKGVYPGTGIGLAISKKIAKLYGGELTVESTVGVGSTFCFTIPA